MNSKTKEIKGLLVSKFTIERNPEAEEIAQQLDIKGFEHIEVERPPLPKLTSSVKLNEIVKIDEGERIARLQNRTSPEEFDLIDIGGDITLDEDFVEELPALVKQYNIDRWGKIQRSISQAFRNFFNILFGGIEKAWFEYTNKKVRKAMVKDLKKKGLPKNREFAIKGTPIKDITVDQLEEASRGSLCCIRNPKTGSVVVGRSSDISKYQNHEVVPMMIDAHQAFNFIVWQRSFWKRIDNNELVSIFTKIVNF